MGYYTAHTMRAEGAVNEDVARQINKALEEKEIIGYALDTGYYYDKEQFISWDCADSAKWYSHEEDMLDISRQFPDVTFLLSGEGENQGDMWDEYFHNGTAELCTAEIVFKKPTTIKWPPDHSEPINASGILDLLKENSDNE